ncbi:MAG: membrane-bound dehydrogenase, partial [Limisphaerales bacterium]
PGEVLPALRFREDDAEFIVRHQLALSLGAFRDERATTALARLAEREGGQPQMRVAILSSVSPASPVFAKLNQPVRPAAVAAFVPPRPSTPDRAKVIAGYAGVAALPGVAARGLEVFKQHCATCHRLKGEGAEVGPDLGMAADKPVDWLLTAIFDPNAAVEDRFRALTVRLKTGGELTGIVSAETANNLVLRLPTGLDLPVLRGDIATQTASGRSLMPEGVETLLKPQDVADLIAHLRPAQSAVKP